ncbi:OmpW/AlkL family protein [Sphingomonas arenae]|uniref:OmpW/AlkL family protein n=1 Tax=Sphingomonas arenae TaxID=2812555 RepID=UPI0019675E1E|nr:OmpW family protein [Sphingomonas arenae]
MKTGFFLAVAAIGVAAPAHAEAGDILLRARAIAVAPQEDSSGITPAFSSEEVKVSTSFAPEVDITYMATDNIGFELIAATTKHKVSGKTGTTGSIGKLASTWVLPPTLTAQYHFNPKGKVRPYVGVGVNYTLFYSEKASDGLEAAVGNTDVKLDSSFGLAAQVGLDVAITDRVFLNLDAKYIDIDTDARLATAAAGTQRVKVSIDPLVFGIGIGTKF